MTQTTPAQPDLAQHVAWLEQLLKPGHQIARTKQRWYLKKFDSWLTRDGHPRMAWTEVDSDRSLEELLARLGETG